MPWHAAVMLRSGSGLMKRYLKDRARSGVDDAASRVALTVMRAADVTHVVSVGPIYQRGGWVVEVGIDPYTEETATFIRDMVAPDRVVVSYQKGPEY